MIIFDDLFIGINASAVGKRTVVKRWWNFSL